MRERKMREQALTGAGSALALVDLIYHMVMIRRQR
jgi:hypothetical protein